MALEGVERERKRKRARRRREPLSVPCNPSAVTFMIKMACSRRFEGLRVTERGAGAGRFLRERRARARSHCRSLASSFFSAYLFLIQPPPSKNQQRPPPLGRRNTAGTQVWTLLFFKAKNKKKEKEIKHTETPLSSHLPLQPLSKKQNKMKASRLPSRPRASALQKRRRRSPTSEWCSSCFFSLLFLCFFSSFPFCLSLAYPHSFSLVLNPKRAADTRAERYGEERHDTGEEKK